MNQPWIYMCSPSGTPPPASLPIPSVWVFPVHQPWALVSCIQPGLVICFTLDSNLVSMLFSQIIPPSPSPTELQSLFCTSVSLFLFCILGYCYHLLKFHVYASVYAYICDPMNCSTPGLPVHQQLLKFTQTHVYWVGGAIQPSILCWPLLLLPMINHSQHQGLFKWVISWHSGGQSIGVSLQHQSFQWIFRMDFL